MKPVKNKVHNKVYDQFYDQIRWNDQVYWQVREQVYNKVASP
jgi:hypothetical protein